jgi:alginate O-acetyltransferase complex protein AlgI
MLFCSQQFLVFFLVVFVVYWAMPWRRARVGLLLVASIYFYSSWNPWLAWIIGISATLDYLVARGMDASSSRPLRLGMLMGSLVMNLGLLCYFKYANFFLASLQEALRAAGASASFPVLSVVLPIGISFYTFEAINYTVDVYRRQIRAERNLLHFMLFILFFPHLVAGPIVRARDFLPQIRRRKRWSWDRMHLGCQFLLMGLFKKLAIADHMALYADPVFANPQLYSSVAVWLATLAYALQIYGDFSGYSDMAVGAAHMLGYKLARNFNMPYLAVNVSDFWRRWHISLSTWLRDYLFIPLGGSQGSRPTLYRNLLITMALGGLWHGASWTFVMWGVLHGTLLIVHRLFRDFCLHRPRLDRVFQSHAGIPLRIAMTFLAVSISWVLFRATTFETALTILKRLAMPHPGAGPPLPALSLWCLIGVVVLAHLAAHRGWWERAMRWMPAPAKGLAYALMLNLALVLAPGASKTFIYFQF